MTYEPIIDPERKRLLLYYLELPNDQLYLAEKWAGLISLGYSELEADKLCKPKEIDKEAILKLISEQCEREQREFLKEHRRKKSGQIQEESLLTPEWVQEQSKEFKEKVGGLNLGAL